MTKLLGTACAVLLLAASGMAESATKPHHRPAAKKQAAAQKASSHPSKASPQTSRSSKTTTAARRGKNAKGKPAVAAAKAKRGQQGIESERARQIQEALIRESYLSGEASGSWDASTKQAMMRFQSDNGWQARVVPDSRALIKLGLGPTHADVINPAAITQSIPASARDLRPGGAALSSN